MLLPAPASGSSQEQKREFIIYESIFSDIPGILFFNAVVDNPKFEARSAARMFGNFIVILFVSILGSGLIIGLIDKTTMNIKFFLMTALLVRTLFFCSSSALPSTWIKGGSGDRRHRDTNCQDHLWIALFEPETPGPPEPCSGAFCCTCGLITILFFIPSPATEIGNPQGGGIVSRDHHFQPCNDVRTDRVQRKDPCNGNLYRGH